MRGTVPGLPSPHPLLYQLPAVYLEHDFVARFLSALDEVVAPLLLTLDNLPAHLDPRTAPADLVDWVAGWLAIEVDEEWSVEQRRAVLAGAVERHRWRGTRRGLAEAVRLHVGGEPEILENGGASWSSTPLSPLPGTEPPWVTVRVRVPDPEGFDRARLEGLVAAEIPAHVGFEVEILPAGEAS